MGSNLTAKVVGRCPQQGVLPPLLWSLVVDKLLVEASSQGFNILGYVVDIIIIIITIIIITIQGKFAHTVRALMQRALNVVIKWANKEGIKISPHKIAIVPFTNKRKVEGLGPLTFYSKEPTMLGEVIWR
jgi:hypothetical protein